MIRLINSQKKIILLYITFFVSGCILLYKALFSVPTNDEAFYATEGLRFAIGQRPFIDDWHIAQMFGIIISPLVLLFRLFSTNNDGIILFLRVCYVVIQIILGVLLVKKFGKEKSGIIIAVMIYIVFAPKGIRSLSYNTLSIDFITLTLLTYNEKRRAQYFSGIFYALSVMCTPFLAFLLILYLCNLKKNKNCVVYFLLGICTVFFIFLIVLFRNASVNMLLNSLFNIIDSAHSESPFKLLTNCVGRFFVEYYLYAVPFVILQIVLIIKKELNFSYFRANILLCTIGIIVILIKKYQITTGGYDLVLIPISLCGLSNYVFGKSKTNTISTGFLLSFFDAIAIGMSSNTGLRGFSAPLILAAFLSIIVIYDQLNSYQSFKSSRNTFKLLVVFFTIFWCAYSALFNYGGVRADKCNSRIESGPLQGIFTSYEYSKWVEEKNNEIVQLKNDYINDYFCFLTYESWPYLSVENDICSFSTYTYSETNRNEYIRKTNEYFNFKKNDNKNIVFYVEKNNMYNIDCGLDVFYGSKLLEERSDAWILLIE